ncbi:fumarylacetoacetate hydrolase family protein [Pelomonas sp. KK5]|uniref:fumarylacetoacetate hydrolase family protein n=1 Tax=Pelomonas sp. KK5 TaxID=1855730 RepID=UPI00097C5774|nr:fumarylacetoacetate hydrolase family protein [Pelomonas sp. KK5]
MKIARYGSAAGPERFGVVVAGGMLLDVAKAAAARSCTRTPASVTALIEGGPAAMDATRDLQQWAAPRLDPGWTDSPDEVRWLTPVPPRSMICAGRNFGRHRLESAGSGGKFHSDFPTGFIKLGRTLVPHRCQVLRPPDVLDLDYEAEIALVLGPGNAVFGYTIFNDLSAREWQLREMHNGMILLGKNFPGFGPLGPYLLTADEVPDPAALVLWLKVNGELRQRSDCRDLIFGFDELVAFWSRCGLGPGDLIATGTPGGVALHHKPDPRDWYLKPGDHVQAGVDGIGVLDTFIV